MSKLFKNLSDAKQVILNYPLVILSSLTLSLYAMHLVRFEVINNEPRFDIIFSLGIGISVFFSLKMLSQRVGKSVLLNLIGVLILLGIYFYFPESSDSFYPKYTLSIFLIVIASHLFVAFAPFMFKNKSEVSFWQYNKNLFVNTILTIIFTGVLNLGVGLAILALKHLFSLNFNHNVFAQTSFFILIFGSSFIFLLFNEKGLPSLEADQKFPVVLKFFTQFVLIPLLLIYVAILYVYSCKILINSELPQGWISYLILAYSLVGILALLLIHPLKTDTSKSWIYFFNKVFYFSLLPLLVLLFIAIKTRILEYGYTELRYFVFVLAIWLSLVVMYFIFVKKNHIRFIPISLFCFVLFSLLTPYYNVFSVSIRSQKNELETILVKNKLLENDKINFKLPVTEEVAMNVSDKFKFLRERNQNDYLISFLPKDVSEKFKQDKFYSIFYYFENTKFTHGVAKKSFTISLERKVEPIDVSSYDYVFNYEFYSNKSFKIGEDTFDFSNMSNSYNDSSFTILFNNERINYKSDLLKLFNNYKESHESYQVEELQVLVELNSYDILIIFDSISIIKLNDKDHISVNNPIYLIRKK